MPANRLSFLVPRQSLPYSCGPATLAAASRLLGQPYAESRICQDVSARPDIGTPNEVLAEWARRHLSVRSVGSGTYEGGLAIWNIRNAISGRGHYVLVLGQRRDRVRYYDPYWAQVFEFARAQIAFSSGDDAYKEWAVNFATNIDFFDADLEPDQPFNPEWALVSLQRWLDANKARPAPAC